MKKKYLDIDQTGDYLEIGLDFLDKTPVLGIDSYEGESSTIYLSLEVAKELMADLPDLIKQVEFQTAGII